MLIQRLKNILVIEFGKFSAGLNKMLTNFFATLSDGSEA